MPPIRRICFDAFGTIFSPREAVHVQYVRLVVPAGQCASRQARKLTLPGVQAKVARSFGLQVEESKVKAGFRAGVCLVACDELQVRAGLTVTRFDSIQALGRCTSAVRQAIHANT